MTRVTAGWPFEAVRSFESAERTEAHLDLTASLHRVPTCDDVWKYLYMHLVQFLLVSPYLSRDHLLDLRTVGKQEQLLAKALIVMAPEQQDYATAPYPGAFNWPTVFKALELLVHADGHHWKQQDFYVIVFRSLLAPAADYSRLSRMDEVAHAEATRSGGLLKYWFGEPDGNSRNLATCIWRNAVDAKKGGQGEGHQAAMRVTRHMFSEWKVEQHRLVVADDVNGWRFEECIHED